MFINCKNYYKYIKLLHIFVFDFPRQPIWLLISSKTVLRYHYHDRDGLGLVNFETN